MTPMLKQLHREAELQRRFILFGDIKLAQIESLNKYELALFIRMGILK